MSHMRNIVMPYGYLITPIVQPTVDIREYWEGVEIYRERHTFCVWRKFCDRDIWKSFPARLCTSAPCLGTHPPCHWPMRGLYSELLTNQRPAFCCLMPPCVSKGLWNDLTDYYHQFLAKSRLVFTGPVPTEQSDQSQYKGRIQPWAHKIILNTTPASFSTLG